MTTADIGLIGLGTMGSALALNIADNGYHVAVWNRTTSRTMEFAAEAGDLAKNVTPTETLADLVAALKAPRAIILMVPAGQPVDDQIAALRPLLDDNDLIIDAGNANFHETNRRAEDAGPLPFLGIGVSGGEEGARFGPAIMGGGKREYWTRVEPILEAISAKFNDTPCATWMGQAGAGHFVKTVHNGIEYADMQLIAEVYGILRDGKGMSTPDIGAVFGTWNEGRLSSYLIEISAKVAGTHDAATDAPLLDVIVDAAGQKGTGRWTAIEAQMLGTPVSVIEAAVAARNMSAQSDMRAKATQTFTPSLDAAGLDIDLETLEAALTCGKIICYSQGFSMISAASDKYDWALPLPGIARNWRAGCIIRSAMLDDMASALEADAATALMFAPAFADILRDTAPALRRVVASAAASGIPVPAFSAALGFLDTLRTARGTTNMIQGQRDFFGLHGFKRLDTGESGQHGPWAND